MAQQCLCAGNTILATGDTAVFVFAGLIQGYSGGIGGGYYYIPWYVKNGYYTSGGSGSSSWESNYPQTQNVYAGYSVASSKGGERNITVESKQCYQVVLYAGTGGSVSGSGTYIGGTTATVTATPINNGVGATSPSYQFSSWSDGGAATHSIIVNADTSLSATFSQITFRITAQSEDTSKGTVSVSGWTNGRYYTLNQAKTATATPEDGYKFAGWFRQGYSQPDYVTPTADLLVRSSDTVYTAKFSTSRHLLTVASMEGGSVTSSPSSGSIVNEGDTVTITATPDYNYTFSRWAGMSDAPASHSFTMPTHDVSVTAEFTERNPLTLTLDAENGNMGSYALKRGDIDVDFKPPVSGTASSPASSKDSPITVPYVGASDTGGSGLRHVELWVKKDGGAWSDTGLRDAREAGSFSYLPEESGRYAFMLVAEDNDGNRSAEAAGSGDCSTAFSQTDFSGEANVILASNGGIIKGDPPQYSTSYPASKLIDGSTSSYWRSAESGEQAIIFGFGNDETRLIRRCELQNGSSYRTKGFEVYASALADGDGDWALVSSGELPNKTQNNVFSFDAPVLAKRVKLVVTSGYYTSKQRWYLYEFRVFGVTPEPDALSCSVGAPSQAVTHGEDVSFTVKFSRPVTGFTVGNISLSKTGTASGALTGFSGEGDSYTVGVTGITGAGTLGISVAAGACSDSGGSPNEASNSAAYIVSDEPAPDAGVYAKTIYEGVEYTLVATVTDDRLNRFAGWYSGETLLTEQLSYAFTPQSTADIFMTAKFAQRPSYTIELRPSDGAANWNTQNPAYVDGCELALNLDPDFDNPDRWLGGSISVTATPADGWAVKAWSVSNADGGTGSFQDQTGVNLLVFDLSYNCVITCVFERIKYTVSATVDAPSASLSAGTVTKTITQGGALSPNEVYHNGKVTFEATPATGYGFGGWFDNEGNPFPSIEGHTQTTLTDVTVTSNLALTAKFTASVTVRATHSEYADDTGTVSINGGEAGESKTVSVIIGGTCTIKAISTAFVQNPDESWNGSQFNSWYVTTADPQEYTSPLTYFAEQEITVSGHTSLTAHFIGHEDTEYRYLAIRNLDNNASPPAHDPMLGILSATHGEEIEKEEWDAFYYGTPDGSPDPQSPRPEAAGDRYYKFVGSVASTVTAAPNASKGFMEWRAQTLVKESTGWSLNLESTETIGTETSVQIITNRHLVLTAVWGEPTKVPVRAKFANGSNETNGSVFMSPKTEEFLDISGGIQDMFLQGDKITLSVSVKNGYVFAGWFRDADCQTPASTSPVFEHTVVAPTSFYAKFLQDASAIYQWEGRTDNKMMTWRSKRFVAAQPLNLSSARVYADRYPLTLRVFTASSPDAPSGVPASELRINEQGARRLPVSRPEKYVELEVAAQGDVTEVAASTSMGGLNA